LINKVILTFKDEIIEDLETPNLNGIMDKEELEK
jgi:hypothetical protein